MSERRLWWLLIVVVLVGINMLVAGCSLVGSPNLSRQLQDASAVPVPLVMSDAAVWIVVGQNAEAWGANNSISQLFLYTAEVTLASLTIAALQSAHHTKGYTAGASGILAMLGIFRPGEFSLVYTQGMVRLNDGMAEYLICQAAAGSNTVPRDAFTPCGATLFLRTTAAVNLVMSQKVQLLPRVADLENTEPVRVELPRTMILPRKTTMAPSATKP